MKKYIALDIGGTAIKYGVYTDRYEELEGGKVTTEKDPPTFLKQIIAIVSDLKSRFDVLGVAISIGGFIDPVNGKNDDHTVGLNFKTYNLKKEISEACDLPTELENDANCAAIAEYVMGAGRGSKDICVLTVGTGIGGALINGGKLWRGSKFRAGEFGLMSVNHELADDSEKFTQANAMAVLVMRVKDALGKDVDGEYIFSNLADETIYKIYNHWLWELAVTAANVLVCFDPELLLIGGGISAQQSFIDELRRRIYHLHPYLKNIPVKACELKNNAGKIGAVYHFKDMQGLL